MCNESHHDGITSLPTLAEREGKANAPTPVPTPTPAKPYDFEERWPANLIKDFEVRRRDTARSLASLKSGDTSYRRAHERVVRMLDAALSAMEATE